MKTHPFILLSFITSTHSFPINVNKNIKTHLHLNSNNNNNNNRNAPNKGFNILEKSSAFLPQGTIVSTVKQSWKFIWERMMVELAPQSKSGSYTRPKYSFNSRIGDANFPDEGGRYHLYVGNPCPWCHRTLLSIRLRNITLDEVGITHLLSDAEKATRGGWIFSPNTPKHKDPIYNSKDLYTLYNKLQPNYEGRCTAPLLVDKKTKKIVSNESSDIVRMLSTATFGTTQKRMDIIYPQETQSEIDKMCDFIYENINNGVYQCGFSTTQSAYDTACNKVREGLDKCNTILSTQDYLCTKSFTMADLYLLPTILRYDGVYSPFFKAGGVHINIQSKYPYIHQWLKRCWDLNGGCIRDTIDVEDAQLGYYKQLFPLNPGGIVPMGITLNDMGLDE